MFEWRKKGHFMGRLGFPATWGRLVMKVLMKEEVMCSDHLRKKRFGQHFNSVVFFMQSCWWQSAFCSHCGFLSSVITSNVLLNGNLSDCFKHLHIVQKQQKQPYLVHLKNVMHSNISFKNHPYRSLVLALVTPFFSKPSSTAGEYYSKPKT